MYIAYCETVVHYSRKLSLPRLAAVTARWFLCEGLGKYKVVVKHKLEIIFIVNNIYNMY